MRVLFYSNTHIFLIKRIEDPILGFDIAVVVLVPVLVLEQSVLVLDSYSEKLVLAHLCSLHQSLGFICAYSE